MDAGGPHRPEKVAPTAAAPHHADRPVQSMGTMLARSYENHASSAALVGPEGVTTYSQLQQRVHQVGNALAGQGMRPGDRVAIWLDNCPQFLEIEQACFSFGFVRTALGSRLHLDEVTDIVRDCSASVVIAGAEGADEMFARLPGTRTKVIAVDPVKTQGVLNYRDLVSAASAAPPQQPPTGEDLAALLYTSGTTGQPKGAMLTHRNWVAMVSGVLAELPPIGAEDVVLHSGPMSHLSGSIGTACAVRGAAAAMVRRFEPGAVLQAVADLGVTVLPLVPTMLAALTTAAERGAFDLSSIRAIPYGGSAVAPGVLRRAQAVFGDVLVQVYGLSESLVPLSVLSAADHRRATVASARRLASAGRPTPFVELRVITESGAVAATDETGEIQVRSDTVMAGYWGQPESTRERIRDDGWVRTGDVGYRDHDGYLYIVDRQSDVIVSGGFNVYPTEVERAIQVLPQVDEVVVVGTPHERWGETVTAVVTLKPGQQLVEGDVIDACRATLAGYKKPTCVAFVEELPKNSSGKLLRREVRGRFWADRDRSIGAPDHVEGTARPSVAGPA
jgi:long-chain acyl-CoA synthetase